MILKETYVRKLFSFKTIVIHRLVLNWLQYIFTKPRLHARSEIVIDCPLLMAGGANITQYLDSLFAREHKNNKKQSPNYIYPFHTYTQLHTYEGDSLSKASTCFVLS